MIGMDLRTMLAIAYATAATGRCTHRKSCEVTIDLHRNGQPASLEVSFLRPIFASGFLNEGCIVINDGIYGFLYHLHDLVLWPVAERGIAPVPGFIHGPTCTLHMECDRIVAAHCPHFTFEQAYLPRLVCLVEGEIALKKCKIL